MKWRIVDDAAWHKVVPAHYRHYSGVSIIYEDKSWCAVDLSSNKTLGYRTSWEAIESLLKFDSDMLEFYEPYSRDYGHSHHVVTAVSSVNPMLFTFWALTEEDFPSFVSTALTRYFFGIAKCTGCGSAMNVFQLRRPKWFDGHKETERAYLACSCGGLVWQMRWEFYEPASIMLEQNRVTWNRKSKLAVAGGKHTPSDMQKVWACQGGRCIYCHRLFTEKLVSSKDHLLPLVCGGSNWALNIVLACRNCNSRRNCIPFRTYCTLLSPTQNRRIFMNLARRIREIDYSTVDEQAVRCFETALAKHDSKHPRYKSLKGRDDRNVKTKRLLPNSLMGILRAYEKELKQKLRKLRTM